MRRLVVAGLFLVLTGLALYGQSASQQPFVVQYIDGIVQIQLKGQTTWQSLKLKVQVPADATVRLAKGAMIELARDRMVLPLIKEGVYPIASLLSKIASFGLGIGSTVAQKIKAAPREPAWSSWMPDWSEGGYSHEQMLLDEREKIDLIVRKDVPTGGFEIDNLEFFYWGIRGGYADHEHPRMYEEYKNEIDGGIRALIHADYTVAIERLRNAVASAIFPEEVRRAQYLLAVAYAESGLPVRAWKIISGMTVAKNDLEFNDFLIRKAQIQVDTLQFADALATLKPLLEPLAKDEFSQAACLVAYCAWKGLDRDREASEMRQKGLRMVFQITDEKGGSK